MMCNPFSTGCFFFQHDVPQHTENTALSEEQSAREAKWPN
ncbi:hypothetical protein HMPREF9120_02202 [Neisseria sp. oral taxon 020 str. F0370]|nr:hypothetical protein HMPREF9120_02202 [Neisseria sp. oral taxon 020 str. F0370]